MGITPLQPLCSIDVLLGVSFVTWYYFQTVGHILNLLKSALTGIFTPDPRKIKVAIISTKFADQSSWVVQCFAEVAEAASPLYIQNN